MLGVANTLVGAIQRTVTPGCRSAGPRPAAADVVPPAAMTGGRRRLAAVPGAVGAAAGGCSQAAAPRDVTPECRAPPPRGRRAGGRGRRRPRLPLHPRLSGHPSPGADPDPQDRWPAGWTGLGRRRTGPSREPSRWAVAGCTRLGTRPGDPGSAVILGHVDCWGWPSRLLPAPRAAPRRSGHHPTRRRLFGAVRRPADRAVPC